MINTKYMKMLATYNYYGVTESVHQHGPRLYMSIIDHRVTDSRLDGVYDRLGVYLVDRAYVNNWALARGIKKH